MSELLLDNSLRKLAGRVRRTGSAHAGLWGTVALAAAIIGAMWIDLALDLPGAPRLICGLGAIVIGAALAANLIRQTYRQSKPDRIARQLDRAAMANGQIVAGAELCQSNELIASGTGAMTAGLAALAVRQAARLAASVSPETAWPANALWKPARILCAVTLGVLVLSMNAPRLVNTQIARFVDPFGDHPPYSALTFGVEPGDTKVPYGGSVEIKAVPSGGTPERVETVLTLPDGKTETLPMFQNADGAWHATVANVTDTTTYLVRAGRARTTHSTIHVLTKPRFEQTTFRIQLPDYTNRPAYEGPLPQGGIAGLPGTTVTVQAQSNRPLSGGELSVPGEQGVVTTPLSPASIVKDAEMKLRTVEGTFQIRAAGTMSMSLRDIEQQTSTDTFHSPVIVLKDDKPMARILEPKANSFATPNAIIENVIIGEDDYGVSAMSLYRTINDSNPRSVKIDVPTPAPTRHVGTLRMNLGEYGLNPGDEIKLFARVEDTDPSGAKGSESSIVTIHIISQKEMDQLTVARAGMEVLEAKYAAANRRLEAAKADVRKLAEELKSRKPDAPLSAEDRKKMNELAERLNDAGKEIEKLHERSLDIDLDKALEKELADAKDALDKASKSIRDGAALPDTAGALEKAEEALKGLGEEQEEFKKEVQVPLEFLSDVLPLLRAERRFIELAREQRDLADRVAALSDASPSDSKARERMSELHDEQTALREELKQLQRDLDDGLSKLPQNPELDEFAFSVEDFMDALAGSGALEQMGDVEQSLLDRDGATATTQADQAARTLDALIAKCEAGQGAGEQALRFQPALGGKLGDTLSQLLGPKSGGKGRGPAGKGGFSQQRSTMRNVGMYGAIPLPGPTAAGQGGDSDGGARSRADGKTPNVNPEGSGAGGTTEGAGQGIANVPSEYRKRVGDYFRRVADEIDK